MYGSRTLPIPETITPQRTVVSPPSSPSCLDVPAIRVELTADPRLCFLIETVLGRSTPFCPLLVRPHPPPFDVSSCLNLFRHFGVFLGVDHRHGDLAKREGGSFRVSGFMEILDHPSRSTTTVTTTTATIGRSFHETGETGRGRSSIFRSRSQPASQS